MKDIRQRMQLDELKKLASGPWQPKWKSVVTDSKVTKNENKKTMKIRAQCCKPGACSPK